ncbi:MAG: single-stranded DNA-binding protein [Variovorax sp.]
MNRIQLIGRLGRDPEAGQSARGGFATFSLATHEFWTDRASGEVVEHTEWHQLVCYDRLAEVALEFLVKGSEVFVEGRPRTTRWTDKDGREQRATEIRVDELKMLRRAPKSDPVVLAAKSLASVEKLMRDAEVGLRSDVTMGDLVGMVNSIRTGLVGEELPRKAIDEATA